MGEMADVSKTDLLLEQKYPLQYQYPEFRMWRLLEACLNAHRHGLAQPRLRAVDGFPAEPNLTYSQRLLLCIDLLGKYTILRFVVLTQSFLPKFIANSE